MNQHEFKDQVVSAEGDDLIIQMRLEGTFHEDFELQAFPFDIQSFQCCIAINCRLGGKMPVHLSVDPKVDRGVETEGFQLGHEFKLAMNKDEKQGSQGVLGTVPYVYGTGGRKFPSLRITFAVQRRSDFYVKNIVSAASRPCTSTFLSARAPL